MPIIGRITVGSLQPRHPADDPPSNGVILAVASTMGNLERSVDTEFESRRSPALPLEIYRRV